MYNEKTFDINIDEDAILDESPPKIVIIISLISLVLLVVGLFFPWISLAPIEVRKGNMHIFQEWIQTLKADNPNIKEYVDQIGIYTDVDLRLEPLIDKQGFEKLRMILHTIPSVSGIQLLKFPETAVWIKVLISLELSLVVFALLWLISSFMRIESAVKKVLAGLILVISSGSLLFIISLQPVIDTLGFRNKFGLVLLMTIFEAKPGVGLWLCMIANICLGITFLFYLAANDTFSARRKEIEQDEWY